MSLDGDKSHLREFHKYDPGNPVSHFATGYRIFHDDISPRSGAALLESTRMSHAKGKKEPSPFGTHLYGKKSSLGATTSSGGGEGSQGQQPEGGEQTEGGEGEQPDMYRTQPQPMGGTAYQFETGTFMSRTGLPPLNFKPYSTEYHENYDDPRSKKEMLNQLTEMYGTRDALHNTRPTVGGYPPPPQTLESTLSRATATGTMGSPGHTSRVVAF